MNRLFLAMLLALASGSEPPPDPQPRREPDPPPPRPPVDYAALPVGTELWLDGLPCVVRETDGWRYPNGGRWLGDNEVEGLGAYPYVVRLPPRPPDPPKLDPLLQMRPGEHPVVRSVAILDHATRFTPAMVLEEITFSAPPPPSDHPRWGAGAHPGPHHLAGHTKQPGGADPEKRRKRKATQKAKRRNR